jgi:HD-like signal output (HDOD) protein
MSQRTTKPQLRQLLAEAKLPALPQSAVSLMQLVQNPENGPPEFTVVIEADPGLTAQVLRFVNSSYFGFSTPVSIVRQAITLVGVRVVTNFVLWTAIFRLLPNPMRALFNLQRFREDSLRRALFARAFGRLCGVPEVEHVFTAALLQDMAIPFLVQEMPVDYLQLLHEREDGLQRLSDLEQHRFGWTHAEAAALLSQAWGLPPEFAELIENHVRLESVLAAPKPAAASLAVSLSALLPASGDGFWSDAEQFLEVYERFRRNGPPLEQFASQLDDDFCELASVLSLKPAGPRLADRLAGAARPARQPVSHHRF